MGGIRDERVVLVRYVSGPPALEVAGCLHRFIQRGGHRVEVRCGKDAPVVVEYGDRSEPYAPGVRAFWDFVSVGTLANLRRATDQGDSTSVEKYRQELGDRGYQVFVVEDPGGGPTTYWLVDPREWDLEVC